MGGSFFVAMGEDVTQLHAQIELLLSLHIVNMSGITSSLIEPIPHCTEQFDRVEL